MKLDLSKPLTDLDGQDLKDGKDKPLKMGALLAQDLISGSEGPAVKFLDWALTLHKGEIIDIDEADLQTLKEHVQRSARLTVLAKGQILKVLNA